MLTEQLEIMIDNINASNKTISVAKDTIVLRDGVEISRSRHRCAFAPGDLDAVKAYTGFTDASPEIVYLNAIWTPDVVSEYQALIAANDI
jgi:hypothetical protein